MPSYDSSSDVESAGSDDEDSDPDDLPEEGADQSSPDNLVSVKLNESLIKIPI